MTYDDHRIRAHFLCQIFFTPKFLLRQLTILRQEMHFLRQNNYFTTKIFDGEKG